MSILDYALLALILGWFVRILFGKKKKSACCGSCTSCPGCGKRKAPM